MFVDDNDQALDVNADGGDTVLTSTTPTVCTIVDDSIHPIKAGTCKISVTNAGDAEYKAATAVKVTVVISQHANVIEFANPEAMFVGDDDQLLDVSADGGDTVLTGAPATVCSIVDGSIHALKAGTCKVKAANAGDAAFKAATAVTKTVVISKRANAISLDALSNMTYGDDDQPIFVSETGGMTVLATSTKTVCTIVDDAVHIVKPGACKIKVTNTGNDEYLAAAPVLANITIAKADNSITITSEVLSGAHSSLGVGSYTIGATNSVGSAVTIKVTPATACAYSAATGKLTIKKTTSTCTVTFSNVATTTTNAATSIVRTVN
jgi:uncharacterized protein (DUF1499 family)